MVFLKMHILDIFKLLLIIVRSWLARVLIEVVFRAVLFVCSLSVGPMIALSWVSRCIDGLSEVSSLGSFREILMVLRVMYGWLVLMIGVFPIRLLISLLIHGRHEGREIESALRRDWLVVVHELVQSLGDVICGGCHSQHHCRGKEH